MLPLRTKIPKEDLENPPLQTPSSSQVAEPEEPTQDELEVDPTMVQEHQEATDDDEPSVSTRPWTRSQGPPPALAGTPTLSKCALSADLINDPNELQQGLSYKVAGWVSSIWEEL